VSRIIWQPWCTYKQSKPLLTLCFMSCRRIFNEDAPTINSVSGALKREREREREREKPLGHFFSLGVSSLAGCQSHWMVRPLGWSPDHQSKGESTQKAKISNDFWHFTIDRVVPPSRRASFQSQSTCLLDALIFKRFSITLFVYLMHITFGRSAF
jgi:hypothetical protein